MSNQYLETCTFVEGWQDDYETGGTYEYLKWTATKTECAELVRRTEPTAIGATYGRIRHEPYYSCYAEFGATGKKLRCHTVHCEFETCLFNGKLL